MGRTDYERTFAAPIDLRSDLMGARPPSVADAMATAATQPPAMSYGEDPYEQVLMETLVTELGVEAALLVPTCTMANQIAIRLHLPDGGAIASGALAHIVTVEARATALTGVTGHVLAADHGHPAPDTVADFLRGRDGSTGALVWLENTHMLSAGSVMPAGWQDEIAAACRGARCALHLDGSRLWNAAVAQGAPMSALTAGCDTVSLSLNKAIGAPLGSVLVGSKATIEAAKGLRDALGGEWRPIGVIAAAASAALEGWRERLEAITVMTKVLADKLVQRLGAEAAHPASTNLIFLNRPTGDGSIFVEVLARLGVKTIIVTPNIVRLAIHNGVRAPEVERIVAAIVAADAERAAAA